MRVRATIHVKAEGALARLAHDIRLEAHADAVREGDVVRAVFRVDGIRVVATSRHAKNAFGPPSPSDAEQIEERVRTVALPGDEVRVVATRESIEVTTPRGLQVVRPRTLAIEGDAIRGSCELRLGALGAGDVRAPLGAVKTADVVVVEFETV